MKKLDLRTLVMLLCVASMTVFASCDNKGNEPDDPATEQGGSSENNGGGEETPEPETSTSGTENGYDYVDLGLPSGTLWADRNVGADSPEDYGDYFAWGEIAPKEEYGWNNYKWCNEDNFSLTKYCTNQTYGFNEFHDGKTILDPEDDAATVNMGSKWRMPTEMEIKELKDNCSWAWVSQNDVIGRKVIGPNGNSIFLPAAGWNTGEDASKYGYYWANSLGGKNPNDAWYLDFGEEYYGAHYNRRLYGCSVRAVKDL